MRDLASCPPSGRGGEFTQPKVYVIAELCSALFHTGFLTEFELEEIKSFQKEVGDDVPIYLPPLKWVNLALRRLWDCDQFPDYLAMNNLIGEVQDVDKRNRQMINYSWIGLITNLVQTLQIMYWLYMGGTLMITYNLRLSEAIFTIFLALIIHLLFRCIFDMLNPFKDTSHDFETAYIIDRNVKVGRNSRLLLLPSASADTSCSIINWPTRLANT